MDGEANLPAAPASAPLNKDTHIRPPVNTESNLYRSFNATTSSSSSSFSSSPPDFLRNVQAAFKRHRPLGVVQSNNIRPRRALVPQRETSKSSGSVMGPIVDTRKTLDEVSLNQRVQDSTAQTKMSVVAVTQEDASITPPSISGTLRSTHEMNLNLFEVQSDKPNFVGGYKNGDPMVSSEHVPMVDGPKKVQFVLGNSARSQGVDDNMATGTDNLSTYMSSLALTEMECDVSNRLEASTVISQDARNKGSQSLDHNVNLKSDGGVSLLANRSTGAQDHLNRFRNFLQSDFSQHMTQSSVVGSTCATTTLVNLASAPMVSSTSYCTTPHQKSHMHDAEGIDVNCQQLAQSHVDNSSHILPKNSSRALPDQADIVAVARPAVGTHSQDKDYDLHGGMQSIVPKECDIPKDPKSLVDKSTKGVLFAGDVTDIQSQAPISKYQSSDAKSVSSKTEKQEKPASSKAASAPRKRSYDPDLFFKVNGKLYQRLGKIGSGGSSEVHKVISQDCTIYALKKIKLKGRDYATAFGFCQEIEYLNKLKGMNHIIQLIDYEVTDKALLKEVLNGSMSNKDGRVKDDGYIYMVLEYGEIDLAHMLSQKWKELDSSKSTIDENWLRFYWQQILLAVNTIHEERIVHSDLKPANFLLVRGSLKLIDFGIAKAIMSDTTNIQRDSQVGTLSYMSPEAFMCNETDANGNTIKCGRPSDIWSLGCILYQMVYGRTPFAEYKTFWAKFKVITDPNHEISYEPLSNIWLLDLMKKCLAWDRNERWRIPQLLEHPFLVPPIPIQLATTTPQDQSCKFLQLVAESCSDDSQALILCSRIQRLLKDPPIQEFKSKVEISREERRKVLLEMSNLCLQLRDKL